VYVDANVAVFYEFRNNEYAVVWRRSTTESNEEADIGVSTFFHEAPFTFEVFCDIIILFGGWEDFFYGDIYAKVST
jgi:hypothetical protein